MQERFEREWNVHSEVLEKYGWGFFFFCFSPFLPESGGRCVVGCARCGRAVRAFGAGAYGRAVREEIALKQKFCAARRERFEREWNVH